jgi:hypothetical protein
MVTRTPGPARWARVGVATHGMPHRGLDARPIDRAGRIISGRGRQKVTIEGGYEIGQLAPGRRRRPSPSQRRPLRGAFDGWLRAGGWQGGTATAGSISIDLTGLDATGRRLAKEKWRGRLRNELRARRWEPEPGETTLVHYEWSQSGPNSARLSWWTDPAWTRRRPPEETDVRGGRTASRAAAGWSDWAGERPAADDRARQVADLPVRDE